jgi:ABC-2 type transport system permease protein
MSMGAVPADIQAKSKISLWEGAIAFYTLWKREMVRYLKSPLDTIAPPIISTLLFIFIFGLALGSRLGDVEGFPYIQFMLPGLVMMAVIMNSFYNPAYSVFQSRWQGNIADFLSSPLSCTQMAAAIILAGVCRGMIVGAIVLGAAFLFTSLPFEHPWLVVLNLFLVSLAFAGFGCIVGLWTKGWDGVNAVSIFLLDPLVMLGGVFYSLEMIKGVPVLETLARLNPFTYITGGFRYSVLGIADTDPLVGLGMSAALGLGLLSASIWLFRRGYHLKS